MRQSVHALARLYLSQPDARAEEEALRVLGDYWQQHIEDEDALRPLIELLGKHERYQEALSYYEQLCEVLSEEGRTPDARTTDLKEFLRTKQLQRSHVPQKGKSAGNGRSLSELPQTDLLPLFSQAVTQGILQAVGEREGDMMDQLRRQLVGQVLTGTGATILAASHPVLSAELAERLTRALNKPSSLDEKTLLYLQKRIDTYWQDRNTVALPSYNLLPYVLEDLQKLTMLFEGSLLPTVRTHLCTLAATAAMLIGELYYDMRKYTRARTFQELAITAAHEANNPALEAVAWGRNSFAWTYDGHPREAHTSIQEAQHLARSVNGTVRSWLAAVEAEIEANLGDRDACLKALKAAEAVENQRHLPQENYWIYFDSSLLAGYQGVSLLKLSSFGYKQLVQDAQTALQTALDLLDPSMRRRQPTLLVDLASAYVQQQHIEQACECALSAIDIIRDLHSNVLFQRLLTLRNMLEPWKETQYVQALDRSMALHLLSESQQQEGRP